MKKKQQTIAYTYRVIHPFTLPFAYYDGKKEYYFNDLLTSSEVLTLGPTYKRHMVLLNSPVIKTAP